MAIKNYTTKIDSTVSIGEIQTALAMAGASKIMIDDQKGIPTAVSFVIENQNGILGFRLPAEVEGTLRVFKKQGVKADRQQAEKTSWRNIRDWGLDQIALIESCDMPLEQPFLPYLLNTRNQTLFEVYASGNLLPPGEEETW